MMFDKLDIMSFNAEHCIPAAHRAKYGSHPSTANNQDTVKEEAVFQKPIHR